MARLRCPCIGGDVELTEERMRHIADHHPDLLPEHLDRIMETVADPDDVRRSARAANARLLTRWFGDLRGGKHVVVVVATDQGRPERHWVVTAYMARRLAPGVVTWVRS